MMKRIIRFILPLPQLGDFTKTASGRQRHPGTGAVTAAYSQACRQRWRAVASPSGRELESAESGIETFESAVMAQP